MVVFDQEQDRDLMDRGEIERFVELARAGAAVADDGQAEDLFAATAGRPGSARDQAQHLAQVADHGEPSVAASPWWTFPSQAWVGLSALARYWQRS